MSASARSRALVVTNVLFGTITVSLSNSALNPALPAFMNVFDVGPLLATWIIAGFMVSMTMTMPLTGYLGARWGHKRLYLIGVTLFMAGSLAGAMATSMVGVIGARVTQGIASGLMIPLSLTLIFAVYPREQRGSITGIWSAVVMLAPAVGPLCGGLLLEAFSWRALFAVNLPFGLLALLMGRRVLPMTPLNTKAAFDAKGYALIAAGIGLLLLATSRLHPISALSEPLNITLLTLAALSLTLFTRRAWGKAEPLLNLRMFRLRGYRLSVAITVIQSVGMFECLVLLPLLVQLVLGYSAIDTGLALLCTALSASLFGRIGGGLLDRHGPSRVVAAGLLLTGLATCGLGLLGPQSSLWGVFVLMVLRGAGLGLSYMPVTTAGLNVLPDALVTQGAAMNNIARRLAASLVMVVAALYLEWRMTGTGAALASLRSSAIGETFMATGLLIFLALPCALRFPRAEASADEAAALLAPHRAPR
ncbi:DHA2 family efflux MFS transporter permease subunit [Lonsdalea quercina]|uniref:DHA2 family efflux MFS transporter permease subunit n=1 Tax=Lonsdalea quercina TaxID=71657 RepID=UPI0039747996